MILKTKDIKIWETVMAKVDDGNMIWFNVVLEWDSGTEEKDIGKREGNLSEVWTCVS